MDESNTYINMCTAAKSLQEQHKYEMGDYVYCGVDLEIKLLGMNFLVGDIPKEKWHNRRIEVALLQKFNQEIKIGHESNEITIMTGKYEILTIEQPTWLPRQDQLQDILGGYLSANALKYFYEWSELGEYTNAERFYSMEQLWFAYVMKKKYNLSWFEGKPSYFIWN